MTAPSVTAPLGFFSRSLLAPAQQMVPVEIDLRTVDPSGGGATTELVECTITDARHAPETPGLDTTGYTLVRRPSAVRNWYDSSEVIDTYYRECRDLARELTGASHAFTFDHIIREPGRQIGGGGTAQQDVITTQEAGGGYVSGVHMDYTDSSTWTDYLALHGHTEPAGASRVVVLNFWRPLFGSPDRAPLALCDARTVTADDLLETMLYGYGHEGYSWHDIGISVYQVAASPQQRWSYFSDMSPDEVLLMKTYDTAGVIGRGCPHAAFTNPAAPEGTPDRRSIELRVLCFITDEGEAAAS
ncbi:CmcJ/NvfI family oxidoreductase [Blastococcus sp. SYSU D00695]